MANYIVASLDKSVSIKEVQNSTNGWREYTIFNSEDSIKNREKATKLYEELKAKNTTISVSFSKIIESKAFPERLKPIQNGDKQTDRSNTEGA